MATILYFGWAREVTGCDREELSIDSSISVDQLWDQLIDLHPGLEVCRSSSRLAIDLEYATAGNRIGNEAEVAVIPPVAGG